MRELFTLLAAGAGAILIESDDTTHANLGALLLSGALFTAIDNLKE